MRKLRILAIILPLTGCAFSQTPKQPASSTPAQGPWEYSLTIDGYVVPHGESYVDPIFTADHDWLHLEARYNYEDLQTGSLWAGYNFSAGKKLVFSATPMIGGVFGNTNGIAPGYEVSLSYKRFTLSPQGEYVFDTTNRDGSFFYTWTSLTYSVDWFRGGFVEQRTKAYHTSLDVQRGFLVGVSRKKIEFTTYVFDPGIADPTVVLELGVSF